jgi:hypothetical protein
VDPHGYVLAASVINQCWDSRQKDLIGTARLSPPHKPAANPQHFVHDTALHPYMAKGAKYFSL